MNSTLFVFCGPTAILLASLIPIIRTRFPRRCRRRRCCRRHRCPRLRPRFPPPFGY